MKAIAAKHCRKLTKMERYQRTALQRAWEELETVARGIECSNLLIIAGALGELGGVKTQLWNDSWPEMENRDESWEKAYDQIINMMGYVKELIYAMAHDMTWFECWAHLAISSAKR